MKRIVCTIISVLMLALFTVPCLASEYSEQKSGDVYVRYVDAVTDVYKGLVSGGGANVLLPDGTKVSATGGINNGLTLVVKPVIKDDAEAYGWFMDSLKDIGTNPYPLDIYFIDEEGNIIESQGEITVAVTLPAGYTTPIICFVAENGTVTVLDSSVVDGKIVFTTTHNSYYAVVQKAVVKPGNPDSPQTGDSSNMMEWLVLLLVSGCALATIVITRRCRKQESK